MKVTCTLTVDDYVASSRSAGQRIITAAPGQIKALRGQRMVFWTMAALTIGGPLLALPGSIYLGLNVDFAFFAMTVFSAVFSVTMVIAFYRSLTGKAARTTFVANEKSAGPPAPRRSQPSVSPTPRPNGVVKLNGTPYYV